MSLETQAVLGDHRLLDSFSLSGTICTDCNVVKCADPSCHSTSSDFTAQCTDQCVVIACNDPEHSEKLCDGSVGQARCDLICDNAANCTDCHGFDAFLDCCIGHYSPSDIRCFSEVPYDSWDPSLNDLLCACGHPVRMEVDNSDGSVGNESLSSPELGSMTFSSTSSSPAFQATPQLSVQNKPSAIPYRPLSPPPVCQWGDCYASFQSLSELLGHVNVEHIPLSTFSTSICFDGENEITSCMWRDCNLHSSPESIPGPSSGDQHDALLDHLSTHLLQDHLGLPLNTTLPLLQARNQELPSEQTESQSEEIPSHSSTSLFSSGSMNDSMELVLGVHQCNWQDCDQSFSSYDELTKHITAIHVGSGKAQYECFWNGCNRNGSSSFSSKQKICRHLQSHTGHRPFQCQVCQQNFSEAATLQQHMRRHTQEKPYICDFPNCGKSFAIAGALTIHKRVHNGHKPFKCTYCERAFAESSNLSKHLRTHTGARPYICAAPGCKKSFARPDQLSRHMSVHRKKDLAPIN